MARDAQPVVLELATLPREQIGPFLLLGVSKEATTAQIEENWSERLKWARRNLLKVPLEDINWAKDALNDKERWSDAAGFLQRATRIKEDPDALEKLFFFTRNAKNLREARKVLDRLHDLRPNDPQLELYELDLIEVKSLADIEKLLGEIDAIVRRYPTDPRVRERAVNMVGDIIPLMGNLCDQLTDQMAKVINQVRDLPQYQINWTAVRDVMRDLLKEFQKLRRITGKCLPLVENEEHKRIIRDLADHIDKKMDACRSMGA
jgi:hypothetical protein